MGALPKFQKYLYVETGLFIPALEADQLTDTEEVGFKTKEPVEILGLETLLPSV